MVIVNAPPTMRTIIKKHVTAAMIATFGVVVFESSAAAEQKLQKLTGAQIRAKLAGMELTDEAHWGEVFERNGKLTITHGPQEHRQMAGP